MTPLKEIGECLISHGETDYFFRPSFINMASIGSPEEIVEIFHDLHKDELTPLIDLAVNTYGSLPDWLLKYAFRPQASKPAVYAAMSVLVACCKEDVSPLIGELVPAKTGKRAFLYRPGALPVNDMVVIARSLIEHGIIGKAKVRRLQRHESGQGTTEFNAFEYISAARTHLGMSREEAEQLTMTEFQQLLAAKFPEQKGFTKEEYDAVQDGFLERQARRRAEWERKQAKTT